MDSMKSAFPAWLKRIDPILETEETNSVYQAFRGRRERHRWNHALRRVPAAGALVLIGILLILANENFGRSISFELQALLLAVGLGLALYYSRIRISRRPFRVRSATYPIRVSDVFTETAWQEQPAMDLWMTGARGQDIAEAMYLERRERWLSDAVVPTVMVFLLGIIPLIVLRSYLRAVDVVILSVLTVWMAGLAALRSFSAPSDSACARIRNHLRFTIVRQPEYENVPVPRQEKVQRPKKRLRTLVSVGVSLACLVAAVVYYGLDRQEGVKLTVLIVGLVVGLALHLYVIGFHPERNAIDCVACFREANAPFTYLMCTLFQDDPDAARWAWLYRGIEGHPPPKGDATLARVAGWLGGLRGN